MRNTLTVAALALFVTLCLARTGIGAPVTIAHDGFEGLPGELGHTVTGPVGAFAAEQTSNVRTGSQSLQAGVNTGGTQTATITFNPIDLSDFFDVSVSVWWTAPNTTAFESTDNLTIRFTHDGNGPSTITLLDVNDSVLDANSAYVNTLGFIPDDATTATLEFLVTTSEPGNEDIFFDDILFSGTMIPEPSTLSLGWVGMLAVLTHRRRRSKRTRRA